MKFYITVYITAPCPLDVCHLWAHTSYRFIGGIQTRRSASVMLLFTDASCDTTVNKLYPQHNIF